MKTKTNINLIANGTKVYTRKTTGRPYTHALVVHSTNGWRIESCSSKGAGALLRAIEDHAKQLEWYRQTIAGGPTDWYSEACLQRFAKYIEDAKATRFYVCEIVNNAVTVTT
jgi:hypothetical protein